MLNGEFEPKILNSLNQIKMSCEWTEIRAGWQEHGVGGISTIQLQAPFSM